MSEKFEKLMKRYQEETEKECYKITCTEGKPEILEDKIGGMPYLPEGEEYPLDADGNPMALLIQVNLKNIQLKGYPQKGILEIFMDRELDYPAQYQIRYFEEGLPYQTDLPEVPLDNFITNEPIRITVNKDVEHMTYNDYRFSPLMMKLINEVYEANLTKPIEMDEILEKEADDWYDEFFSRLSIHAGNIGGYPDFTQNDPRYDMRENKDECLVKIDTMLSDKIMIGDCGIIFVLISQEDIENGNFQNAIVDWDCC